jgi:hypothetical protein
MGYMRHHTIVVTSWDEKKLQVAHDKAVELFHKVPIDINRGNTQSLVSPIVNGVVNGYGSFFIAPDGSKEGWEDSDNGDKAREAFINYCREQAYDDGSNSLSYVEIQFGDDRHDCRVLNSGDDDFKMRGIHGT